MLEKEAGVDRLSRYPYPSIEESVWYHLAVVSDGAAGPLAISINGTPVTTHNVSTAVRVGRSGLYNGNSGGAFDNFALQSPPLSFQGFFAPVENAPVQNSVRAGAAVPVKFSLSGDYGLGIFMPGYPASQPIACGLDDHVEVIEETVPAGKSGLSYDAAADRYVYVWKTERGWANTCRQLVMIFTDGSTQSATFRFER